MASYALGIDVLVKGLGGLNQVNSALNRIDKNGATVASTFRLVRGAFIALGGAGVLKAMLDVATAAEKTNRQLTALYGGAQLGKQAFDTEFHPGQTSHQSKDEGHHSETDLNLS